MTIVENFSLGLVKHLHLVTNSSNFFTIDDKASIRIVSFDKNVFEENQEVELFAKKELLSGAFSLVSNFVTNLTIAWDYYEKDNKSLLHFKKKGYTYFVLEIEGLISYLTANECLVLVANDRQEYSLFTLLGTTLIRNINFGDLDNIRLINGYLVIICNKNGNKIIDVFEKKAIIQTEAYKCKFEKFTRILKHKGKYFGFIFNIAYWIDDQFNSLVLLKEDPIVPKEVGIYKEILGNRKFDHFVESDKWSERLMSERKNLAEELNSLEYGIVLKRLLGKNIDEPLLKWLEFVKGRWNTLLLDVFVLGKKLPEAKFMNGCLLFSEVLIVLKKDSYVKGTTLLFTV